MNAAMNYTPHKIQGDNVNLCNMNNEKLAQETTSWEDFNYVILLC